MVTKGTHWALIGAVVLGLALLGGASWKVAHGASEKEPARPAAAASASVAANDQVARDLKRLEASLRATEQRVHALQLELQNRGGAPAAEPLPEKPPPTPEEALAQQREEQQAWDDELSLEPRDERWARVYEHQLRDFVAEANANRSSHVTQVACRTSLCRLEVAHDVPDEMKPFTMDLLRHLTDTTATRVVYKDNTSVFHVVRKGYPMPDVGSPE
jgi:hypothetical protein